MSVILGITAACILIIWGILRKTQLHVTANPVLIERYLHPGHTWMRITEEGDVLVGIDDFAQNLVGTIEGIELPRILQRVEQGEAAWVVWHQHRSVPFVSPVSGRVIQKNEMVLRNPMLVNASPYGDGWLLRIRPRKLKAEVNNLFTGKAVTHFLEHAKEQLVRIFSTTPALMYQDGGVIMKDLSDRVSDDEWKMLAKEFFLAEEHSVAERSPRARQAIPPW
jgi:glycine cleavage system H protein